MTIFYGARDLLDITEAVTPPRRRARNWRRVLVLGVDAAIVASILVLAIAACVATP